MAYEPHTSLRASETNELEQRNPEGMTTAHSRRSRDPFGKGKIIQYSILSGESFRTDFYLQRQRMKERIGDFEGIF